MVCFNILVCRSNQETIFASNMFSQVVVFLAALAAAQATAILHGAALASTGTSLTTRTQDSLGNFAFRSDIADAAHVRSHAEVGSSPAVHAVYAAAPAVVAAHSAPAVVRSYAAPLFSAHAAPLFAAHAAPAIVPAPYAYGLGNGLLLNHGLGYGYGYNKLVL